MKFKSITLHNFMRYKGDNKLEFSCDDDKNVTVVLGNNTFGKTTLAQAFRWGLYEELNTTSYTKKKDIILLNHDVVSSMTAASTQVVFVEIVMEDGDTQWKFCRQAMFKRKNPGTTDLSISQIGESKLTMIVVKNGVQGSVINNNGMNTGPKAKEYKAGCVQETINNMLPQKLSNYFFFDGERWSDTKTAKGEIKDSIDTILGVTGLLEMKKHIKDGPGKTVLKTLRDKIKGSGNEYDRLQNEIRRLERDIERYEETITEQTELFESMKKDRDRLESELSDKHKVEEDQKQYKQYESQIEQYEKFKADYYADIVKSFSNSARFFAASLLPEINALLSSVELQGKDIPGVTTDTVDYLINLGRCLCGEDLAEGSEAYQNLMQLKKVIPPEMIGGAAGKFQDLLMTWQEDNTELISSVTQKADDYETTQNRIYSITDDKDALEKRMDRKANVAAIRKQYENAKSLCRYYEANRNEAVAKREYAVKQRDIKISELDALSTQNEANKAVNHAIAYAEAIYAMADRQAKKKQDGVFEELNAIIADNFDKMFNDSEKYAKLEDDYRVHVYYHNVGGKADYEEQNLSNGEATAINFVYIVSVLELARRRSLEYDEEAGESAETNNGVISLPLVLDGPFSSLSNENTNLIAQKLPEFAEQVIIFMLDKDWEASGLDEYTLPGYCCHINKEERSNSSSFERGGI